MQEKYFKINKDYKMYKDYFDWYNGLENRMNKWEQFRKLVGIESESFVPSSELYIIPTQNDLNNFGRFFCKETFNNGIRKFRKNTTIQKDWERFCSNNDMLRRKPDIIFDFMGKGLLGKISSRLFHYKDEVYVSINGEFRDCFEIPEGYTEIKGSEFYKVIETLEEEEENAKENNG